MTHDINLDSLPEIPVPSAWGYVESEAVMAMVFGSAVFIPIVFLVIKIIFGSWLLSWPLYIILVIGIAGLMIWLTAIFSRSTDYRNMVQRAKQTEIERSSRLNGLIAQYEETCRQCHDLVRKIRKDMEHATDKYNRNLFGQFWDAVEALAGCFGEYHDGIGQLSRLHSDYESTVKRIVNAEHNFPAVIPNAPMIPVVYRELKEFRVLRELGESNRDFALIWESRRTREVLIAGFKTLQASIEGLERAIVRELGSLQKQLSSRFDR